MGVIYVAVPPIDDTRKWLEDRGISGDFGESRLPTVGEICSCVRSLSGYGVEIETPTEGGLFAIVEPLGDTPEDRWTQINVLDYSGPDQPCTPVFEKGSEHLIIQILSQLAKEVGSLALIPDTGELPVVVDAGADAAAVLGEWNRARNMDDY